MSNITMQGKLNTNRSKPQEIYVDSSGNVFFSAQNTALWAWPNTLYTDSTASGAASDNAVIYTSANISVYNYHLIENTSTTDPVDVYVSVDGTNYASTAASVLLQNDVTTGGGVKVITIPINTVGILEGKYKKIQVLKDGVTAETPSIRYAHTVK